MRKMLLPLLCAVATSSLCGETIEGTLSFDKSKVQFSSLNRYDVVSYDDLNMRINTPPGEPQLPAYHFQVLIPANAEVTGVTVSDQVKERMEQSYAGLPMQLLTNGSTPVSWVQPLDSIYLSAQEYPYDAPITYLGTTNTRGYKKAHFKVNVFGYNPLESALFLNSSLSYAINYEIDPTLPPTSGYSPEPNRYFREMVQSQVVNGADIDEIAPFNDGGVLTDRTGDVDLLIITNNALKESFEAYATQRQKQDNLSTAVVTVEDIKNDDTKEIEPLEIKRCIQTYVKEHNTNYVILGGDVDVVPVQTVWVKFQGKSADIPADNFYADLSEPFNWDAKDDGEVGQLSDKCDLEPDVILGRLPFKTPEHVELYMNKLGRYFYWSAHSEYSAEGFLMIGNRVHNDGDGELLSELMFDTYIDGHWDNMRKATLYDNDDSYQLTGDMVFDTLPVFNAIHETSHGNYEAWGLEGSFFTKEHARELSGRPNGVIATAACETAYFDNEDKNMTSLAEVFLRESYGGPMVYLGSSRLGWVYSGGKLDNVGSHRFNGKFFGYLLNNPHHSYINTMGDAFTRVKQNLASEAAFFGEYSDRWIHFSTNFLGDPSLKFFKEEEHYWWELARGVRAKDIGAGSDGTLCIVGDKGLYSGNKVFKLDNGEFKHLSGKEAIKVDVDPNGNPWIVCTDGSIAKWTGSAWENKPGQAKDIGIGGNGVVYIIDKNNGGTRGNYIAYWDGTKWTQISSVEAVSISVDGDGNPWITDNQGYISRYIDGHWEALPGKASSVSVGHDGKAYCVGLDEDNTIFRWTGKNWQKVGKRGTQVEAGPDGTAYSVSTEARLEFGHPEENLLYNYQFVSAGNDWNLYNLEGGQSSVSYKVHNDAALMYDRDAIISITNGGSEKWSVLFAQSGLEVEKGETYMVSFWAKQANANGQSVESDITVSLNEAPWTEYGSMSATFTNEMQRYSFEFTMEEDTDKEAILQFCLGKLERDVYIDYVRLSKKIKDIQAPSHPKIDKITADEDGVHLSWEKCIDNSGLVKYRIGYKEDINSLPWEYSETEDTQISFTELEANTEYVFYISALDYSGNINENKSSKSITTRQSTPQPELWVSTTIYYNGDVVRYNGQNYRAKWWTLDQTPGTAAVWELM